jgi:hypothetical protein
MSNLGLLDLVLFAVMWAVGLALPAFLIYTAWRFLRAYEKRALDRREPDALKESLLRIEQGMRDIGERQVRLAEDQHFLMTLLTQRTGGIEPQMPSRTSRQPTDR